MFRLRDLELADAAMTDGAGGAVGEADAEQTVGVETGRDASIAIVFGNVNGHALGPGAGGFKAFQNRGETSDLLLEGDEKLPKERLAIDRIPGRLAERGRVGFELRGERSLVEVEADADDRVGELGGACVDGSFRKDAAKLLLGALWAG